MNCRTILVRYYWFGLLSDFYYREIPSSTSYCHELEFEFEFIGVLRHMQRYIVMKLS